MLAGRASSMFAQSLLDRVNGVLDSLSALWSVLARITLR